MVGKLSSCPVLDWAVGVEGSLDSEAIGPMGWEILSGGTKGRTCYTPMRGSTSSISMNAHSLPLGGADAEAPPALGGLAPTPPGLIPNTGGVRIPASG